MASESGYSDKNVDMCANSKKKLLGVGQATLRGEPGGPSHPPASFSMFWRTDRFQAQTQEEAGFAETEVGATD